MHNSFAEQTGSGAVIMLGSMVLSKKDWHSYFIINNYTVPTNKCIDRVKNTQVRSQ